MKIKLLNLKKELVLSYTNKKLYIIFLYIVITLIIIRKNI